MAEHLRDTGASVRSFVEDAARTIGESEVAIVDYAGNAVKGTVKSAGSLLVDTLGVSRQVAGAAIDAVQDIAFRVGGTGRNLAKGLLAGVEEVGGDILGVAQRAARGTINGAADVGSDAGAVVEKAVGGAINLVGNVGTRAVGAAKDVLVQAASGVKEILGTIVPAQAGRLLEKEHPSKEPTHPVAPKSEKK